MRIRGSACIPGFQLSVGGQEPALYCAGAFEDHLLYDQFLRFLTVWFSSSLSVTPATFRKQFATQSGRSGGASAAANANDPAE